MLDHLHVRTPELALRRVETRLSVFVGRIGASWYDRGVPMSMVRVLGVHPIAAQEPVHLVEIEVIGVASEVDWGSFTQPMPGSSRDDWQAPYDERPVPAHPGRWCFFFHYLDRNQPLQSFAGNLALPPESPIPSHLRFIKYEGP